MGLASSIGSLFISGEFSQLHYNEIWALDFDNDKECTC